MGGGEVLLILYLNFFTFNISKGFPGVESRIRATEYNRNRTDFKYY
jgi:hypothetical protein